MSCRLETISDPKLKILVDKYGTDNGMTMWLKEYGNLTDKYEVSSPISYVKMVDLKNKLEIENREAGTAHKLEFYAAGKPISELQPSRFYTSKVVLDWGSTLDSSTKYYGSEIEKPMFDEDGNFILKKDLIEPEIDESDITDRDVVVEPEYDDVDLDRLELEFEDIFGGEPSKVSSPLQRRVARMARSLIPQAKMIKTRIANLGRNMDSLKAEIDSLMKSGKSMHDPEIIALNERIKTIMAKVYEYRGKSEKINSLLVAAGKNATIESLDTLFAEHKKFAQTIANMKDPDDGDVVLALKALSAWSGIFELIQDDLGDIDDSLGEFASNVLASVNDKTLLDLRSHMKSIIKNGHGKELNQIIKDYDLSYGKDINAVTRDARALGDTKIKLLTLIDNFIKKASFNTNNELFGAIKKINAMFDKLKKNGLSMDMFLDIDSDGNWSGNLIGRLKQEYHKHSEQRESTFDKEVERANKLSGSKNKEDRKRRDAILRDAINIRNRQIVDENILIDPRRIKTEADRLILIEELIKETNDREYSINRVNDAFAKYSRYLNDFTLIQSHYNDLALGGHITNDEAAKKIENFKKYNSPEEYYDYIHSKNAKDVRVIRDSIDQYATFVPRRTYKGTSKTTGFYNDEFLSKIVNDEKAKSFYYEYAEIMQHYISYLPSSMTRNISASFLPNVQKDFWSRITNKGAAGFFSGVRDELIDSVTSNSPNDSQYGRVDEKGRLIRAVPIRFMKEIPTIDKSRDLKAVLLEFAKMSIAYKHATAVEDKVQLQLLALESVQAAKLRPDGSPSVTRSGDTDATTSRLENAIKMAEYAIDANLYGAARDTKEGVLESKFFNKKNTSIKVVGSTNPIPLIDEFNKLARQDGNEIAANKMKEMYPDNIMIVDERQAYKDLQNKLNELDDKRDAGIIDKGMYDAQVQSIESAMSGMGRNNVISKWIDQIINYGAYKAFAWNPFPVISNGAFGVISIMNHAAGGQDYSSSDARFGIMEAHRSAAKSIKESSTHNDKVYQLANRFGVVSQIMENLTKETNGLMKIFGPFGLLSSSDYTNRTATMVAMMRKAKITDLKGKERSLFEAFNNDGTWNTAEFGDNLEWNGDPTILSQNKELFKFTEKIRKINMMLHGNMDAVTRPRLKKHAVGRLLAQYRLSWMAEGVASRFEERRYDDTLERNVEGRYITAAHFIRDNGALGILKTTLKIMAFQGDAAFGGMKLRGEDKELIKANMKKNFHELFTWCALTGVYLLLSASIDDDDEDKGMKYTMLNTLNRVMGDITFYISPMTFNQIFSNPIPAMSIANDAVRFQKSVIKYFQGDEYYDEEVLLKNFARNFPGLNLFNKVEYRSRQILNNQ